MHVTTNRMTDNGPVQATVTLGGHKYDSASFAIPNGSSNFSLKSETPTSGHCFNNITRAFFAEVYSNKDITIRLNSVDNDPIELEESDFPWKDMHVELTDIFISNDSGEEATVKVLLF